MARREKKEKKKSNIVLNVILVIALLVFAFSLFKIITMMFPYYSGSKEYDKVKDLAKDTGDGEAGEPDAFQVNFDELLAINPDTVAWIRFDEPSVISYPVVQGADNNEYLSRTFQANDNLLGAIFMNYGNHSDFSDKDTLIYGHNLNWGGEMFSQLPETYKDEAFCNAHPYFYIYTPDGKVRTYQVFAAAVVNQVSEQYIMSYKDDAEYQAHIDLIKSQSIYQVDVNVDKSSQIVSLSTCTNVVQSDRFLMHGVLIETRDVKK
ncbi:class B sortase [Hespellia stercorisuis]|uniref:Sortase B n=1 Tax=Hespellia stercorisuis DSM 15480 TaxID=1121950 RepID=A0A1M6P6Q9_9FIRM|nr:class B sortase [Hespellia stercorisuis]SHK03570.1 sortase B [Hespellia stercorisuis DSM 15480]